ncbi:ceramide glucosyltransferase-like [Tubulanus polymorphus]|uniref:ceramide glucosyltransferase-like n=1 Tax=Tubulanus polymorphus TaxID=672921 RepID=UPI003DA38EE0
MVIMNEILCYMKLLLALIPWPLYGFVTVCSVISIYFSRRNLNRPVPSLIADECPDVSIIKPLMGVDRLLETNLETYFLLTYPKYEILFCVQDEQDPVIDMCHRLMARFPIIDCKLFIGGKSSVINPMVQNMSVGYENAQYGLIWISSSRIKATQNSLQDMVIKIRNPNVAIVHQIPFTSDQKGVANTVEKLSFGGSLARYYIALNRVGLYCLTGMSYLMKKDELDALGGLTRFGKYLAEDHFLSKALYDKGFTLQLSDIPAQQNVSGTSIVAYKDRMVRWSRLRLAIMPFVASLLEPLIDSITLGLYMSWSTYHFFSFDPYIFFVCHIGVWVILDYTLVGGIQNGAFAFSKSEFLVAWLIREVLQILIHFEALVDARKIKWGKRTYKMKLGGDTEVISEKLPLQYV